MSFRHTFALILLAGTVPLAARAASDLPATEWYKRCGAPGGLQGESVHTGWLSQSDYLAFAADQRTRGCYPVSLKAEISATEGPARLYRATFKPHPDNIVDWRDSLSASSAEDAKLDASLIAKGYVRIWQDALTDPAGETVVQGIWTKPY